MADLGWKKFLPFALATEYPYTDWVVVDNGSTDDSLEFLKKNYPTVKIYAWDKNYGFTSGYNKFLEFLETPYIALVNSDIEVEAAWLQPLVEKMEADPQIAAIQPKIKSWHQKSSFEYAGAAGGWVDAFFYPFCKGRLFDRVENDHGQYEHAGNIFWASGACCLIRKSVIDQIGLFEDSFFAHMEEIDFCWRAQNIGYKIMYEPASTVYHVGGGTLPQGSPRKTFLNVRNSLAMMRKNLPDHEVFPKIFMRLILDGVWGIQLLLKGKFASLAAILRAHFAFYGQLGFWKRRRKEIYGNRKIIAPIAGYYPKSIVWQYFIKGKKDFPSLAKGYPTMKLDQSQPPKSDHLKISYHQKALRIILGGLRLNFSLFLSSEFQYPFWATSPFTWVRNSGHGKFTILDFSFISSFS